MNVATSDLAESVVRVLDRTGRSAGTGFAAGAEGIIVTCAHVVLDAQVSPGGQIELGWGGTVVRGTVVEEYWSGREVDDIAVVRVEAWPEGLRPLPLSSSSGAPGAPVETWGFPDASSVGGLRGLGVAVGQVPEPDTGQPVLQLDHAGSVTTGYSGGPVRDLATGHVIAMVHSITRGDRYGRQTDVVLATPTEALRAACPLLRLEDVCPYRSLDVFEEEHARFFFGRTAFVEQMLDQLRLQPRFLAVLGPSGSGKSSVVRAGLLAAIADGRHPHLSDFDRIVTRPAELDELDRRLPGAAHDLAAAVARHGPGVLLVLDQFEELFLATPERRARDIRQLCELLAGGAPVSVVLIMRDDFYGRLAAEAPELVRWVERGLTNIPATLSALELTDIVREPARAVRLRFEEGLAEAIVEDAIQAADSRGDAGGHGEQGEAVLASAALGPAAARSIVLPLLEFTLTRLWQHRRDGALRWQTYLDNKRVAGSLTAWADDALRALPPQLLDVARSLFTSLVHLGNPRTGLPDSRRRRRIAELSYHPDQRPRLDAVLAVMTARRLLVAAAERPGGPETVELVHDVLLREWTELRRWLADDRDFLTWRQHLEPWVAAWQGNPASTDRLLRGADLATAQAYLATRRDEMDQAARAFIEYSDRMWREEQRERAAIQRTLDEHQRSLLETGLRDKAAGIAKLVPTGPARGLLQAVSLVSANLAALPGEEPLGPVRAVLRLALNRSREVLVVPVDAAIRAVAYAPDGLSFAAAGDDRTIRLFQPDGTPLTEPLCGHWDSVNVVAFHPDGQRLASGGEDGVIAVWSQDGRRLEARGGPGAVHALAYADGGRSLVYADEAGRLCLDGVTVSSSPDDPVTAVGCHQHEPWLAVGTLSGALQVLRYERSEAGTGIVPLGEASTLPAAHEGFIAALAIQPEGSMLASGGAGGVIRLWARDADRIEPVGMPWQAHDAPVNALAFGPDGDVLLSASADGRVRLWDVHTRRPAGDPLLGHTDAVTAVAVSPDSTRILTGGTDRTVRLWQWHDRAHLGEVDPAPRERLFGAGRWDLHGQQVQPAQRRHREHIYRLALSPDGRWVATASDDRTVLVSDVEGMMLSQPFTGHQAGLRSVAFSPDGRMVASASTDRTVRLWDRRGGQLGAPLTSSAPVQAVAFAPGGSLLASGGADGIVAVTDVRNRQQVASLPHGAPVTEVVFHPTGSPLFSAGEDGLVRAWTTAGQPAAVPFVGHDGPVRALAVSPGGDLLATGGDDHLLRLWDRAGQPVGQPMLGHDGALLDVTFSPDGAMVLSAARDGTVRVWALDGTQLGDPLSGHTPWATAVGVTPDTRYALSAGADGTLRTWQLGGWRDWVAEACRRLERHPLLAMPSNEAVRAFCAGIIREGSP